MTRIVRRVPDVCGGAPTIEGTRLTPADVVRFVDAAPDGIASFLTVWTYLSAEDARTSLEYCAQQRCLVDDKVTYCQGCLLDTRPLPEAPGAFISSMEEVQANPDVLSAGQVFLGSPEQYAASLRRLPLWKTAVKLL